MGFSHSASCSHRNVVFVDRPGMKCLSTVGGIKGFPGHLLVLWDDGPIVNE